MVLRACVPVLVVLACLAPRSHAEETAHAEGDHFQVVVHFDSDAVADAALKQVEALWPPAAALYGLPRGPREKKLTVHLYRDATDYAVAEEQLTKGAFRRNLAFAHFDTKSAHVALQPDLTDDALDRIGLPYLTRSMLLHEAAHLIRYDLMSNFRSHPGWLGDGAAMWLKHRVLAGEAIERAPLSSTLAAQVRSLLDAGTLPSVADLLADKTDKLSFYDRYAVRYLLFRFLRETHGKPLVGVLKKMRRLGGGGDFNKRTADLLRKTLGGKTFKGLDDGFHAFLRGLEPAWEEIYRSLGPAGTSSYVQTAFPGTNALAWRTQPVGRSAYTLSATVEILPGSNHQLNVLIDRSDDGFVSVALTAGYGVTLFEYTSESNDWRKIKAAKHAAVVTGTPFPVEIRVEGKRVDVSIGGTVLLTAELPSRAMTGAYGLGAQSGTAGIWKDVQVK